jgi:hypothetical protein
MNLSSRLQTQGHLMEHTSVQEGIYRALPKPGQSNNGLARHQTGPVEGWLLDARRRSFGSQLRYQEQHAE